MPRSVPPRAAGASSRGGRLVFRAAALLFLVGLVGASCADPAAPVNRPRRDNAFPPPGPPDETCAEKEARLGGKVWCADEYELTIALPERDSLLLTADSAAAAAGSSVTFTASSLSGLPVAPRSWVWVPDSDPDADPSDYTAAVAVAVGQCATSVVCSYAVPGPGRMVVAGYVGVYQSLRQATAHVDVARPRLEIVDLDSNQVVSGQGGSSVSTLVGRRTRLLARAQDTATYALSAPQWTIQAGNPIKDYVFTEAVGRVETLGPTDLNSVRVRFYFTTVRGWAVPVRVEATLTNKRTRQATRVKTFANYNPTGPTNVTLSARTTACGVAVGLYRRPDTTALSLGQDFRGGRCGRGIHFLFTAAAPAGDTSGHVAATQLTNFTEDITPNPAFTGPVRNMTSSNAYWLDDCPLYGAKRRPVGGKYTWRDHDSPGTPLDTDTDAYSRADAFDIYFMYRPSGKGSIWVPLGKLSWNWAGTATRTGPLNRAGFAGGSHP